MTSLEELKQNLIAEIEKQVSDKILENENAVLLTKLIKNADSEIEARNIAMLGTTYKRTGFYFNKKLEKISDETYLVKNEELSFKTSDNAITHKLIIGDNYPALQNLLTSYKNKIKVIYIDPPYGKDNKGKFTKTNYNNSIPRDNLLSSLYTRLKLARDLLKDDGVIFCSIDDKNQAYIKCLFDEIFGEENFVGNLPTIMNLKGNNDEFGFAGTHEYTIVFAKNKDKLKIGEFDISDDEIEDWQFDEKGYYKQGANLKRTGQNAPREDRPNLYFPILINKTNSKIVSITESEYEAIYDKNTKKFNDDYLETLKNEYENKGFYFILPITNNQKVTWRWSYSKILAESDEIIISQNGTIGLYKKQRPSLGDIPSKKPKSLLYKPTYSSGNGTELIKKIFASKVFSNPKPLDLIKDIIKISTNNNDIILDFFAGSGTTAHAVLELNKKDGGNRQFILCTNNETTEINPNGIAYDVTSKRLKRIMTGECYDGTKPTEWLKNNEPYGDNLEVLEIKN